VDTTDVTDTPVGRGPGRYLGRIEQRFMSAQESPEIEDVELAVHQAVLDDYLRWPGDGEPIALRRRTLSEPEHHEPEIPDLPQGCLVGQGVDPLLLDDFRGKLRDPIDLATDSWGPRPLRVVEADDPVFRLASDAERGVAISRVGVHGDRALVYLATWRGARSVAGTHYLVNRRSSGWVHVEPLCGS
jgi:hypothetical protein